MTSLLQITCLNQQPTFNNDLLIASFLTIIAFWNLQRAILEEQLSPKLIAKPILVFPAKVYSR